MSVWVPMSLLVSLAWQWLLFFQSQSSSLFCCQCLGTGVHATIHKLNNCWNKPDSMNEFQFYHQNQKFTSCIIAYPLDVTIQNTTYWVPSLPSTNPFLWKSCKCVVRLFLFFEILPQRGQWNGPRDAPWMFDTCVWSEFFHANVLSQNSQGK
jgi:hypothetical protein